MLSLESNFNSSSDSLNESKNMSDVSFSETDDISLNQNSNSQQFSESAYLAQFWSHIPSLSSIISTIVKPSKSQISINDRDTRAPTDISVPMKTFTGITTTTVVSDVVARPKDLNSSNNSDSQFICDSSSSINTQRTLPRITVNTSLESESFEFVSVETSNSRRRRRARRRLQRGGMLASFTGWIPNMFQSSSNATPGFVQQLVLQALLSPSSQPSREASDAMGRRLYALMTSASLAHGVNNNNLLASQFRPKIQSVTDDEASGDFDLLKPEDKKAARLVELGPINPSFIPRLALTSTSH